MPPVKLPGFNRLIGGNRSQCGVASDLICLIIELYIYLRVVFRRLCFSGEDRYTRFEPYINLNQGTGETLCCLGKAVVAQCQKVR
jgi:hypothetical protein